MSPEERKENLREISSKLKDQDTRVANIFSQFMAKAGRRVSQNPTEIALRAAHKWRQKVRERRQQQQQQSALEEEQQSFLTQVTDMSYGELNENDLLSDQHRLELELRELLITGMTPQFAVTRHDHHISLDVTDSEFLY
jgi:putative cell wall-binding protein